VLVQPDQAILQYHGSDLQIDLQDRNQFAIAEDIVLL
jgi:hypothetical protein